MLGQLPPDPSSHKEDIMTRGRKTEVQELTLDQLERVTGGSSTDVVNAAKNVGETLSNVSKTRSEISMTFARNARA
jgi:hypothetical protein